MLNGIVYALAAAFLSYVLDIFPASYGRTYVFCTYYWDGYDDCWAERWPISCFADNCRWAGTLSENFGCYAMWVSNLFRLISFGLQYQNTFSSLGLCFHHLLYPVLRILALQKFCLAALGYKKCWYTARPSQPTRTENNWCNCKSKVDHSQSLALRKQACSFLFFSTFLQLNFHMLI